MLYCFNKNNGLTPDRLVYKFKKSKRKLREDIRKDQEEITENKDTMQYNKDMLDLARRNNPPMERGKNSYDAPKGSFQAPTDPNDVDAKMDLLRGKNTAKETMEQQEWLLRQGIHGLAAESWMDLGLDKYLTESGYETAVNYALELMITYPRDFKSERTTEAGGQAIVTVTKRKGSNNPNISDDFKVVIIEPGHRQKELKLAPNAYIAQVGELNLLTDGQPAWREKGTSANEVIAAQADYFGAIFRTAEGIQRRENEKPEGAAKKTNLQIARQAAEEIAPETVKNHSLIAVELSHKVGELLKIWKATGFLPAYKANPHYSSFVDELYHFIKILETYPKNEQEYKEHSQKLQDVDNPEAPAMVHLNIIPVKNNEWGLLYYIYDTRHPEWPGITVTKKGIPVRRLESDEEGYHPDDSKEGQWLSIVDFNYYDLPPERGE